MGANKIRKEKNEGGKRDIERKKESDKKAQ